MRELEDHKGILSKIGWIFFVLWILSKISDVLGRYEYQKEFLIIAFVLWTLGAFIDGLYKKKTTERKIKKAFRNSGTTLFGLWIFVIFLDLVNVISPWWDQSKHYLIAASLILLCISFILQALEKRNSLWQIRSACYSIGNIILLIWILSKVFGFFESDQDTIIVSGIILIAIGYVIGVSKHAHSYFLSDDTICELREEMDEIPKRTIMDVQILNENSTIKRKAHVTFDKGDAFVQINENSTPYSFVFFGKGTYLLKTSLQTIREDFMGFCSITGTDILTSAPSFDSQKATEADCNKLGLSIKEIKELALLMISNKGDLETLDDLLVDVRKDGTDIDLKFIKIHEGSEGDYVKVGPIEVADMHNKKTRIRIGGREFSEKGTVERNMAPVGLAYRILTTDGTINITSTNEIAAIHSEHKNIEVKENDLSIIDSGKEYLHTAKKTKVICPEFEISLRKNERATIKSTEFRLSIRDGVASADYNGHHVDVTDNSVAMDILELIRKRSKKIAINMFNEEYSPYNKLIKELISKLELNNT